MTEPNKNIAMMIDIETLSLLPDAFVTQVGVCVSDTATREILVAPTNFWLTDDSQVGRRMDISTVRWWVGQDAKVAAGVFNTPEGHSRCTPAELFDYFKALVVKYPGMTVWAGPAMFDLPILTTLWGSKPWHFRSERDLTTLRELVDPERSLVPPENDAHHDAAADASWQMAYLHNLLDAYRAAKNVAY